MNQRPVCAWWYLSLTAGVLLIAVSCVDIPPPRQMPPPPADMAVDADADCVAGLEACNGADDDCDGRIDEDFNLQEDEANCGACDERCDALPNAEARCLAGECAVLTCNAGFLDCSIAEPGCETACTSVGEELNACNQVDEDCDCRVDEAVPVLSDVNNCGACGVTCERMGFNAIPGCSDGHCVIESCDPGFFNPDGQVNTGCPCRPADARELVLPAAVAYDDAKVVYPGEGADGVVVWVISSDGGLTLAHRGIDADGYWTRPTRLLELERTDNAAFIDLVSLDDGQFGVLWTSGVDLQLRRLDDAASDIIFGACNTNNQCVYTVVDGTVIAARLDVNGGEGEETTSIVTSTGHRLGGVFEGRRLDLPVQSLACLSVDECVVLYLTAEGLFSASREATTQLNPNGATEKAALIARDTDYLTVWAVNPNAADGSESAILAANGSIARGPFGLLLEGDPGERRLIRNGGQHLLTWRMRDAFRLVQLRDDGTQQSDPVPLAFGPAGTAANDRLYAKASGRIEGIDGARISDGVVPDSPVAGRLASSGALDTADAGLVLARPDGDFVTRVNAVEGEALLHLFTHRNGGKPVQIQQADSALFALRTDDAGLRWAIQDMSGTIQRSQTVLDAPRPLQVLETALMPWGDGVLAATAMSGPDAAGQPAHRLQLTTVSQIEDVPTELPAALTDQAYEIAPRLAGPGMERGALLVTNRLIDRQPGAQVQLRWIGANAELMAPTVLAHAATRGRHAVVYSPPSDRTFVVLADDPDGGRCASALGVLVFDGALAPIGDAGLDLRAQLQMVESLGDQCVDAITAVPNQDGGITVTLQVQADFWLLNFSRDGQRMGQAQRWQVGARDLVLWPRPEGARAYWAQDMGVRTIQLGCE